MRGLEIVGNAQFLDFETVMENWWVEPGGRISGRGISTRDADHLVLRHNIIHDFPGAGIATNGAEFLTIEGNIAYNNAWWSTGGVHGITNSSMITTSAAAAEKETIVVSGNLAFANQSVIISHVFSKGFVTLDVDEGNNFHFQNTDGLFRGRVSFSDNLALFGGKSGIGLNTINNITMRNNGFYRNARVVDTGSISIQSSKNISVLSNLLQPRPERNTIRLLGDSGVSVGRNVTTGGQGDNEFTQLETYSAVFGNPVMFDFTPAPGIPDNFGIDPVKLAALKAKLAEYGITVFEPTQIVDEAYIDRMIRIIIATWPVEFSNIELRIRGGEKYRYSYSQRCSYPGPPAAVPCS